MQLQKVKNQPLYHDLENNVAFWFIDNAPYMASAVDVDYYNHKYGSETISIKKKERFEEDKGQPFEHHVLHNQRKQNSLVEKLQWIGDGAHLHKWFDGHKVAGIKNLSDLVGIDYFNYVVGEYTYSKTYYQHAGIKFYTKEQMFKLIEEKNEPWDRLVIENGHFHFGGDAHSTWYILI